MTSPETEWRKIPYVPERYEVSRSGVVRVLPRELKIVNKMGKAFTRYVEGRELNTYVRPTGKSKGHPVVSLSASRGDGSKQMGEVRVCLLVARAFHGCPYVPGDQAACQKWRIRHIDGDINNVSADNLEWVGNNGVGGGEDLYEYNLRRLEELRREPVEDWIRRIWGEDAAGVAA